MKNKFISLFFSLFIPLFISLFFSCKNKVVQEDSKLKTNIKSKEDFYIPKFATIKPSYKPNRPTYLTKEDIILYDNTVLKLKKFLYNNEESNISPDYDYENLYVYSSSEKPREKIYFNAKKVEKEYLFYYDKNKLICVQEGVYDSDAIFKGDLLFFNNSRIFLWKNTSNQYVTDNAFIKGKSKYIMRLDFVCSLTISY